MKDTTMPETPRSSATPSPADQTPIKNPKTDTVAGSGVERKGAMSIQSMLVMLLLVVLIPILCIQALIYFDRFQTRKAKELESHLEVARAVGRTFEAYVQNVLHQEIAIGIAASVSPPLSPKNLAHLLQESARSIPAASHFLWLSPQGRVLLSSTPEDVGRDGSDGDWFKEIAAGKEWVVSDLLPSKLTGKPEFAICRGIRDEKGILLGLVVAVIVPDRLHWVLAFERPGDAGVSILDSKGMNVYRHPHTAYSWEQRNWLKHYPVMQGALRGSEVVATIESEGSGMERLAAFTPVPSIGWVSASSRPLSETMERVNSDLLRHGAMFLGVAFVSMLIAFVISRTIARPMEKIHRHVLSLGRGHWDPLSEISGPMETQVLARSLNWMAGERKQGEDALRRKEAEFRALVENAPDVISLFDRDLRRIYVNAEVREHTGRDASFMMGQSLAEAGYPDSFAQPLNAAIRNVFATGREETVELDWEAPKGHIWLQIRCAPIRDDDGSVEHVMSVGRDITDRKTIEEALRKSEERFRSVVELMSEGLLLFDEQGILYRNPAASRIFSANAPQEMRMMPTTWQAWDASGRPLPFEDWPLSRVLRHESFQNQVVRAVETVTGREFWASYNGYSIRGTDGKMTLGFITTRDITEAKRAMDALHETNQELNEYTYALTHNVKAPFRAIRNYAAFLWEELADALEGEPRLFLEGIRKAVNQAHQQFGDLEALYQIRKYEVVFGPVDMGHFLEEIASAYPRDADRQLILADRWPVLRTEPFLLRQILMGLIDNGFKYNRSQEKRVEVGWQRTADRFEIFVRDNGIGIDPKHHDHIFYIFKRLHTEKEYEGTGIGLAIVKKSAKKIGGKLRIESAVGQGSKFVISLTAAMVEG